MNSTLTGILMFTGDGYKDPMSREPYTPRPWTLVQPDGTEVDIRPLIMDAFKAMHGKPAEQEEWVALYSLMLNEGPNNLDYNDGIPLLWYRSKTDGVSATGFSSVLIHLRYSLAFMTARKVKLEINAAGIKIEAIDSGDVYQVRPRKDSPHCVIPAPEAISICQTQGPRRCIFSRDNEDGEGFICDKFSDFAHHVLENHALKRLRPEWNRIGNCGIIPRTPKE